MHRKKESSRGVEKFWHSLSCRVCAPDAKYCVHGRRGTELSARARSNTGTVKFAHIRWLGLALGGVGRLLRRCILNNTPARPGAIGHHQRRRDVLIEQFMHDDETMTLNAQQERRNIRLWCLAWPGVICLPPRPTRASAARTLTAMLLLRVE